jgi:hypothetical protein
MRRKPWHVSIFGTAKNEQCIDDLTIINTMLYRFLLRIIRYQPEKLVLGRWGYHWDINKNIQKYYD